MAKTTKKGTAANKRTAAKQNRRRWTDVYRTDVPRHAELVATVLDAIGLEVSLRRKKVRGGDESMPHIRVIADQAPRAREILDAYRLSM